MSHAFCRVITADSETANSIIPVYSAIYLSEQIQAATPFTDPEMDMVFSLAELSNALLCRVFGSLLGRIESLTDLGDFTHECDHPHSLTLTTLK